MNIVVDAARREKALRSIVFLRLPDAVRIKMGSLFDDPAMPIPLETGERGSNGSIDSRMLTEEAIISGMLRVLAWDPERGEADAYRRIVRALRPQLLHQLSEAGVAKAQSRDWDVAEEIFMALAGLYPEMPEPFLDLAVLFADRATVLEQSGRVEEAETAREKAFELYRQLLTAEPEFPPAFYNAAMFALREKNYTRAHSLLSTFMKISDDEGKVAEAKRILETMEKAGYLDTIFKEAFDFITMGQEEKGLESARTFVEAHPRVWNGWFLIGWGSRRLRKWEEGAAAFAKAIELGADGVDALNELAICRMELGEYPKARMALEKALRLEGDNVKVMTNLGVVSLRAGKPEEAEGFFRAALDLEPDDPYARGWLEQVGQN